MNRRKAVFLAGLAAPTSLMGMAILAQSNPDASNIQWVQRLLVEMSRIKSGMTRADLLTIFKTEGGLSFTGLERTYVSRHCPYFKVDVTFQPVGRPSRDKEGRVTSGEGERDQIVTISRPYVAFSIMD